MNVLELNKVKCP